MVYKYILLTKLRYGLICLSLLESLQLNQQLHGCPYALRCSSSRFGCVDLVPEHQRGRHCGVTAVPYASFILALRLASLFKTSLLTHMLIRMAKNASKEIEPWRVHRALVCEINISFLLWYALESPKSMQTKYVHVSHDECNCWTELREYPIGFGVRFAQTMNRFVEERSPLINPHDVASLNFIMDTIHQTLYLTSIFSVVVIHFLLQQPGTHTSQAPHPDQIRGFHCRPVKGFDDLWEEGKMEEVVEYLGRCYSLSLPEEWQACRFL